MAAIELEDVACVLCGSATQVPAETIRWQDTDLPYVYCAGCGLKYMRRRPTRAWYARFYARQFWQRKTSHAGGGRDAAALLRRRKRQHAKAANHWRLLRRSVRIGADSIVLEVGPGLGEALLLLREETACRVYAVEPSALAQQRLRDELNIDVVADTLEGLACVERLHGEVDLVILSNVLENTVDPVFSLHTVRRLLKPEGRLLVSTPNIYVNNLTNPYHPYLFSPDTLGVILGRAGFAIERTDRLPHLPIWGVLWPTVSSEHYTAVARLSAPGEAPVAGPDIGALIDRIARGNRMMARGRRLQRLARRARRQLGMAV